METVNDELSFLKQGASENKLRGSEKIFGGSEFFFGGSEKSGWPPRPIFRPPRWHHRSGRPACGEGGGKNFGFSFEVRAVCAIFALL